MKFVYVVLGVFFSAAAQICLKKATSITLLTVWWSGAIALSLLCYGLSFVLYYFSLKYLPISKVSPVMTVGVVILTVIFGVFSGETLALRHVIGLCIGAVSILLVMS